MSELNSRTVTYTGVYGNDGRPVRGVVPAEAVVTLQVNGKPMVRMMCTPTRLKDLAIGFLFNEELIETLDDVAAIEICTGGEAVDVWLEYDLELDMVPSITSGCSGGATFQDISEAQIKIESSIVVTPARIRKLMREMTQAAVLHQRAGGVHAAALASRSGDDLVCVAEDVGRHNTLDKIAGSCLRKGIATRGGILLTSGRVSSEMVGKAARMEVPVVVSLTSPTALSIDLADAWGMTLIGYTRRNSFRIYAGGSRIAIDS